MLNTFDCSDCISSIYVLSNFYSRMFTIWNDVYIASLNWICVCLISKCVICVNTWSKWLGCNNMAQLLDIYHFLQTPWYTKWIDILSIQWMCSQMHARDNKFPRNPCITCCTDMASLLCEITMTNHIDYSLLFYSIYTLKSDYQNKNCK